MRKYFPILILVYLFCLHYVYGQGTTDAGFGPTTEVQPLPQDGAGIPLNPDGTLITTEGRVIRDIEGVADLEAGVPTRIQGTATSGQSELDIGANENYKPAVGAKIERKRDKSFTSTGNLKQAKTPTQPSLSSRGTGPVTRSQPLSLTNAQNVDISSNGNYQVASAQQINHGILTVYNSGQMQFQDGTFTITSADRIEILDGFLTDVENFVGDEVTFSIGRAKDVVNGCINLRKIRNTKFTISDKRIVVNPASGTSFNLSDCGFAQSEFEAYAQDSEIMIPKTKRPEYRIKKGRLRCHAIESTETIETESEAKIQYSDRCFSCLTINPPGNYWYNDNDIQKDLGLHIPDDGEQFRLCLKKQSLDFFTHFDGLVDFVDKKISLTKVINQLKYPFKNNEVAGLLMNNLLESRDFFRVQMQLDDDFLFIKELSIGETTPNATRIEKQLKTITNPSNYYQINERKIRNETHRLAKIKFRLPKETLTQERIEAYTTNYFKPGLTIKDNIATQKTDLYTILILTPDHERISELVN